ncbi:2-isopropylmalate synthase [Weizmannia acidilactici]|uniref:2-isopropylmalate synthase n=1 Tax=Weizmannia acidilactici TaxID=2607726 RepID=A0A5J4JH21_9BACI|nr:2-isopropylmalate synthase [Weizmannia acidilactici]GER67148.1 2-isopropylmalate synthase [Weizmannia acidilactici]GER69658.1 2-isopropylmalate synthase [Weizmannia acidilactici]GER72522.1 2-isopropylmalate synthase [Weizmannia acidilactici]
MRKVNIFDTTLRDGEQSAGVNLNMAEKLEIAKQLERLGVDIIEAGFPASSKGDFQAVEAIAKTVKNSSVTGLARANQRDIDAAWDALKHSAEPRIHVFLATSPIHMTYKLRKTPDEVVYDSVEAVKYAKQKFPVVQWSAEDATRSDKDFLVRIITEVINAGANVINLPDTVGYTTPKEYGALYDYVREHVPNIDKVILSAHCHDDLGMATANTLSAVEHGVLQVEGTINGIGERAGNVALEEVAVALHIRQDYYKATTGLKLNEIKRTSQLVSKLTGMVVPGNKAVVGANAFAHESGIHQDGVLKEASTYEIITPELVGFSSNRLVLGKHSGRHAFKERATELGFDLDQEKLNEAFKAFKALTDKKKEVTDDDLFAILADKQTDVADTPQYELENVQVQYGTLNIPTATVRIKTPEGELAEEAGTGSGSVEAIYHTISKMFEGPIELKDYKLQSVGSGQDALADAFVKVKYGQFESGGRGSAQDVLEASAKAFLNAINRAIAMEQQTRNKVQV